MSRKDATVRCRLDLLARYHRRLPAWMKSHPRTYAVVGDKRTIFIPEGQKDRVVAMIRRSKGDGSEPFVGYVPDKDYSTFSELDITNAEV